MGPEPGATAREHGPVVWEIARLGLGDPGTLWTSDGGSTPSRGLSRWRDREHEQGRPVRPGNYGVRRPGASDWRRYLLETRDGKFQSTSR